MKKALRVLVLIVACGTAFGVVNSHSNQATALWSQQGQISIPPLTMAASQLRVDGLATSGTWRLPAEALQQVRPDAPYAVGIKIDAVSEGKRGLKYELATPAVTGERGLVDALQARITGSPSALTCSTSAVGDVLYAGPLASAAVALRDIVAASPDVTTGSELLCLVLSVPDDQGHETSTATVTADSASGPVSSSTEWHGIAEPSAAERAALVSSPVRSQSSGAK